MILVCAIALVIVLFRPRWFPWVFFWTVIIWAAVIMLQPIIAPVPCERSPFIADACK